MLNRVAVGIVVWFSGGLVSLSAADVIVFLDPTIGEAYQEAQENAFLAATYGLTKIDFDEWPGNQILSGNEYASLGILFSQPGGYLLRALEDNENFTPRSPSNSLFPYMGAGVDERLQLDLTTPQPAVGFWLIDNEFTSPDWDERVEFFDASNQLIISLPMPRTNYVSGGTDGNFFMGVISTEPIARVIMWESPFESILEDVGWDDVYFGLPEPTPAMLLLVPVALRRRC